MPGEMCKNMDFVIQGGMNSPPPAWAGLALTRQLVMGILNVTPDLFSDGGRISAPGTPSMPGCGC